MKMIAVRHRNRLGASSFAMLSAVVVTVGCFAEAGHALREHHATLEGSRYAAGAAHVCRIASDGGVRCRGANANGELGDGTRVARLIEVEVKGLGDGAIALSAGPHHTCAVLRDGSERCWGDVSEVAAAGDVVNRQRPGGVNRRA